MKNLIYEIKNQGKILTEASDEEINLKIREVKKRVKNENVTNVLVDWFALTQEVSFRKIGLRHFDTQLLAGILLHEGKIVEMKTGEGKTLASTLPVALNALTGKGVHVVTVNEYLAERDKNWMGKVYKGLDLSVGLIKSNDSIQEKQKNYTKNITYVTNSEVVFDYLRDSSAYNLNEIVQKPFNFCIIDEIDSILIDEARTPLILSSFKGETNINKLYLAKAVIQELEKEVDFQIDEKRRDINLTESGYRKTKAKLGKKTLYDAEDPWMLEILNALKAEYLFKLNKDYIVLKNKIVIVDEFTGRIMEDRRWSLGIHEAIEIKENVPLGGETKTKSAITYQNFFTLYPKLCGMTGTGKTNEQEFKDIYNLDVTVLPTAKPMIRADLPDLVYQTELAKWKAVLETSKQCFQKGQPILIGTASVEKSEFLSDLFKISKIPHQVLNAKPENVTRESEIVAQAGERYAVTIATNMAGRGTDIILGGNPIFKVKQKLIELLTIKKEKNKEKTMSDLLGNLWEKTYQNYQEENNLDILENEITNLPYSLEKASQTFEKLYNLLYQEEYKKWEKENRIVLELGGLFVLGTERHETRRIDNQLRGRAGRQGDPGKSQFFICLEDDLIKVFGGDSIRRWIEYLIDDKDVPLESDILSKSIENAQKKVELYNYEMRKNVFQYDEILNSQRKQLFTARNELLTNNIYENLILRFSENIADEKLTTLTKSQNNYTLEKWFDSYSTYLPLSTQTNNNLYKEIWISTDLRFAQANFYQNGFLKNNRGTILLSILDFYWTEHLERMSYIRETINWRSYGQQNPLIEYNNEAFKSFKLMFEQIRSCMIYYFLNNPINY
jgi:preprotein translocase subunit SecA